MTGSTTSVSSWRSLYRHNSVSGRLSHRVSSFSVSVVTRNTVEGMWKILLWALNRVCDDWSYGNFLLAETSRSVVDVPSFFVAVVATLAGPWFNITNRYLGLKFTIKGKTHYGWARLTVGRGLALPATLTGYAYETIPDKAIVAGKTNGVADDFTHLDPGPNASTPGPIPETLQPASLGTLALGAQGLALRRRKESAGALISFQRRIP